MGGGAKEAPGLGDCSAFILLSSSSLLKHYLRKKKKDFKAGWLLLGTDLLIPADTRGSAAVLWGVFLGWSGTACTGPRVGLRSSLVMPFEDHIASRQTIDPKPLRPILPVYKPCLHTPGTGRQAGRRPWPNSPRRHEVCSGVIKRLDWTVAWRFVGIVT